MQKINVDETLHKPTAGHTSKGDQPKWQVRQKWYKADHMGYEALAETVVSDLLKKSNVQNFVSYQPVAIGYRGQELRGCASANFLGSSEILIPLERLHRAYCGRGLAQEIGGIAETADRIRYTVDFVEQVTKLADMGPYDKAIFTYVLITLWRGTPEINSFPLSEGKLKQNKHIKSIAVLSAIILSQFFFLDFIHDYCQAT